MSHTFNDKLIAYFTLFSGLAISGIAEYYSIMGLMAIYPTAIIPIVVMGVVLGIGKISGTVWLKQNWDWSPGFLKVYLIPAVIVLMLITSLGVFGFLSKAHSDQSLVSGDVQSKIAIYDEKIKTAKENIEADRKQLKQMDEAVDQVMGRSTDEKGADKANAIRRSQQRDRVALAKDIETNQKLIASLNDEAAPIRAEVRKVEAEVGPIKYIAHLLYGENPDANILEKAVIWVTVFIVIVLDPLAVVLLLASQYSFQRFRKEDEDNDWLTLQENELNDIDWLDKDVGEKPTETELAESEIEETVGVDNWNKMLKEAEKAVEEEKKSPIQYQILEDTDDEEPLLAKHAYLNPEKSFWSKPEGWVSIGPIVAKTEEEPVATKYQILPELIKVNDEITVDWTSIPEDQEYIMIDGQNMHVRAAKALYKQTPSQPVVETLDERPGDYITTTSSYVQNEEQSPNSKWNRVISEAEYRDRVVTIHKNDDQNNTNNPA